MNGFCAASVALRRLDATRHEAVRSDAPQRPDGAAVASVADADDVERGGADSDAESQTEAEGVQVGLGERERLRRPVDRRGAAAHDARRLDLELGDLQLGGVLDERRERVQALARERRACAGPFARDRQRAHVLDDARAAVLAARRGSLGRLARAVEAEQDLDPGLRQERTDPLAEGAVRDRRPVGAQPQLVGALTEALPGRPHQGERDGRLSAPVEVQQDVRDLGGEVVEEAVDRDRRVVLGQRRASRWTGRGVAVDTAEVAPVRWEQVQARGAPAVGA